MSAAISVFRSHGERLRRDQTAVAMDALLPLFEHADPRISGLAAKLKAVVDGHTASSKGWTFVMLSPSQNAAVVRFLAANAVRPLVSLRLWALCFEHLRTDTGEIVLSRGEMADALGVASRDVSRCMSELVEFGAISRLVERTGAPRGAGVVRYFMNPRVATHLGGAARDAAQAAAPILKLIDGSVHPSQRRARAAAVLPMVVL